MRTESNRATWGIVRADWDETDMYKDKIGCSEPIFLPHPTRKEALKELRRAGYRIYRDGNWINASYEYIPIEDAFHDGYKYLEQFYPELLTPEITPQTLIKEWTIVVWAPED